MGKNADATTWDSDVEVSSDDDNDKSTKSKPKHPTPKPPSPQNEDNDEPIHNDPSHLKLSLFDHYNQSKAYNQIRKRKTQQKQNKNNNDESDDENDDDDDDNKLDEEPKRVTINDLKSHRILYEIYNYERKWSWIDSLPTDDINDYLWIQQYSNINLFKHQIDQQKET